MAYKRKLTDFPKSEQNPFVDEAIRQISIVSKARKQIIKPTEKGTVHLVVNEETGEIDGYTAFIRFIEVDEEKFTKIYLSQFSAFWELGKPAMRVFGYIMEVIKPNKDSFIFRLDQCMNYTKYKSKKTIYEGLTNLIECQIIARSKYDEEYYINPMILFNGNRIVFAKGYIKAEKEKIKDFAPIESKP